MAAKIVKMYQQTGLAGTFSVTATVEYPGEGESVVRFIGSVYGGPVVMRTAAGEVFVTDPGRFGEFGHNGQHWVRRFFEAT